VITQWIRLITKDDTTYANKSFDNEDDSTEIAAALVAADDALYVGKLRPFNSFYNWIGTANTNASVMSIATWDGSAWRTAAEVIDGTSTSGKTLAKSGGVLFVPDKDYAWSFVDDTSNTSDSPTELQSFTIYDLYWARITVSADLSSGTTIKRLFYSLTTVQNMEAIDNELSNYLTALGQTDWEKQIFAASLHVLADLKARKMLGNEGQVLSLDGLAEPTAYKVMAMIYFNLGDDYANKRTEALAMYNDLMRNDLLKIDQDSNAILGTDEQANWSSGRAYRV
jgi:hypothetical protein